MNIARLIVIFSLLVSSLPVTALHLVKGLRIWPSPDGTRIVFDITKGIEYKVQTLRNPDRVVIDFNNTKLETDLSNAKLDNSGILRLRSGKHPNQKLRIVLDLKQHMLAKAFILPPNERYGQRLVIDLETDSRKAILSISEMDNKIKTPVHKDFIVALDPGHGGEDPGAIGPKGVREKDVVLAISKKLKILIDKQPGMKAYLIRNGDYYLGFRERMGRARSKQADLFISIHADAYINSKADGASVFVLSSDKNSSVAARWLAKTQNRSDLVGGVSLNVKNDVLASVLFDLTQTASAAASMEAANQILRSMGQVTTLHRNKVESGGFLVLRSPDIPSILVETGFISNRKTEQKLATQKYQELIASSIMSGINSYYKQKARHARLP